MKYLVARQRCTPIAHPRLTSSLALAFLRGVKFHFRPSRAGPLRYTASRDKWRIFFSVILHSRPPLRAGRSSLRKKERIDGVCNFIRCRQHFRATTIPRLSIIEIILFPRRKYRAERGIFGGAEQYRQSCLPERKYSCMFDKVECIL